MNGFKVTYPSGAEEVCIGDHATVEAFAAEKFGSVDHAEHGVTVTPMTEEEVSDYQRGLRGEPKTEDEVPS